VDLLAREGLIKVPSPYETVVTVANASPRNSTSRKATILSL